MLDHALEVLYYRFYVGSYYAVVYAGVALALVIGAAALLAMRRRLPPMVLRLGLAVLALLVLRTLLLGNPLAWRAWSQQLGAEEVGWRQADTIRYNAWKYRRNLDPDPTALLAVGSSQIGALFRQAHAEEQGVQLLSLAGLGPLDYWLFRDEILARNPRRIVLFLSEFDLARRPDLTTVALGPSQGPGWMELAGLLKDVAGPRDWFAVLGPAAVGEVITEYRYGFVFRGLLNKWTGYRPAGSPGEAPKDQVAQQLASLDRQLTAEGFPLQEPVLERFLSYLEDRGVEVLILEGRYRPDAYTPERRALHQEARRRLAALAERHPRVAFLPDSKQPPLAVEDFDDIYHLRPEAAERFTRKFLSTLRAPLMVLESRGETAQNWK